MLSHAVMDMDSSYKIFDVRLNIDYYMTIVNVYGINMQTISAGEFKAKCLKLMDVISRTHEEFVITKRGIPVVKIVPIQSDVDPFGFLKGTVFSKEDLSLITTHEQWEADRE